MEIWTNDFRPASLACHRIRNILKIKIQISGAISLHSTTNRPNGRKRTNKGSIGGRKIRGQAWCHAGTVTDGLKSSILFSNDNLSRCYRFPETIEKTIYNFQPPCEPISLIWGSFLSSERRRFKRTLKLSRFSWCRRWHTWLEAEHHPSYYGRVASHTREWVQFISVVKGRQVWDEIRDTKCQATYIKVSKIPRNYEVKKD